MLWVWALLTGCLAVAVKAGWLLGLDRHAASWMEAIRGPWLDQAAAAVTFFGSSPWTLAIGGGMAAWWCAHQRSHQACIFIGAWGVGLALQTILRLWVGQWRPDTMLPPSPDLLARYELAGFTSGHAFRSALLYGWWIQALRSRRTRWTAAAAVGCALLIALVGASRLYLRRHWLTDVVGAWGVAAAALSASSWTQHRK